MMRKWNAMKRTGRAGALVSACLTLVFAAGCDSGPKLVSVTGTVTENGVPLSDAAVMFNPVDGSNSRPAEDTTGPQGNYMLRTAGRTGIAPGKYRVVVIKAPPAASSSATNEAFQNDPFMAGLTAESPSGAAAKKKSQKPVEHTEEREITDEPKQVQDIDVKSSADATAAAKSS